MKSKLLKQVRHLKKDLSSNSWTNYRKFLGRVIESCVDFPQKARLAGALRAQDVDVMLEIADSLSEQQYADARQHFLANQIALLIKKYPFPSNLGSQNPELKAKEKFQASERNCERMNWYFANMLDYGMVSELHSMRSFISYVLGDAPDLRKIYENCDFGPGASVGVHGNATNVARKFESSWSVSPSAYYPSFSAVANDWSFLRALRGKHKVICLDPSELMNQFRGRVKLVDYNLIAFVPKTAKTHRAIAVEPLLNGFVQKGVDITMRRMLRRIGIDLAHGQTLNSEMARQGSLDESEEGFVTIDLSAASDSISIGLARNLLPPEWFELLNSIRSQNYSDDGVIRRYEKFCSMGNGFCFPLETLIFTAACRAVGAGTPGVDFHVYGDDIIVRKKHATTLISLLDKIGFATNPDKTFISGPFRESCGTDWFKGEDVRPFTLDFELDSLESLFKVLNLTQRNSRTTGMFQDIRPFIIGLIPINLRLVRPFDGPADSGYRVEHDEFISSPYARWSRDLQAWSWYELLHRAVGDSLPRHRDRVSSLMIAALRGSRRDMPFTKRRETRTTVRVVSHG